jgi:hypothetical protein
MLKNMVYREEMKAPDIMQNMVPFCAHDALPAARALFDVVRPSRRAAVAIDMRSSAADGCRCAIFSRPPKCHARRACLAIYDGGVILFFHFAYHAAVSSNR